ncbi:alpha/beta fold hydrolase [Kribbella sp. NPDC051587]|uniref:alpha/beta fold hydrolase n=1 Tax=Kribbella sp. NPDC051587 TaxID=3364119 RepID=UPI00378C1467
MHIWKIGTATAAAASLVVAAAPLVMADTGAAAPPDTAKYTGQTLAWGKCTFKSTGPAVVCASMTVPRDWADPAAGSDLQVYVSKVAATGAKDDYQGIIVTNPGGPGGQGTSLAASIAQLEPSLNQRYDVLGMDPRGTGQSGATGSAGTGLTCPVPIDRLPTGPLDARDRSRASVREHQKTPRAVAEACQSLAVTPYITTWQTAHDMDLLRRLSKADKLNYLGYSYGTWLGAKYTSLFPATTGRVVLDSSVDWQGRLQADFEDFPRMGQRQTDQVFLPWLTRVAPEIVGTTTAAAKQAVERARANAAAAGLDGDSVDSLFAGNGSQIRWVLVLIVLQTLLADDETDRARTAAHLSKPIRTQLDEIAKDRFGVPAAKVTPKLLVAKKLGLPELAVDYANAPLTRYAVACGDQPTKSTNWYKALSDFQGPRYPIFGWQYGLNEVCGPWTDEPRQHLPNLPASVRSKVLVVQGEFDPQTSYEQAMSAVKKAPGVNVLRVDDAAFHGQYAIQGNPCVDGIVNSYFLNGAVPRNSNCSSVPLLGEDSVHPVKGPVDDYLGGHRSPAAKPLLTTLDDTLRRLVGDQLSTVNSQR